MVYQLAYDAVIYKTEKFQEPVALISDTELAAAIIRSYHKIGKKLPQFELENSPTVCKEQALEEIKDKSELQALVTVMKNYETKAKIWNEDAFAVLKHFEREEANVR